MIISYYAEDISVYRPVIAQWIVFFIIIIIILSITAAIYWPIVLALVDR
jgi:hypothetical protein